MLLPFQMNIPKIGRGSRSLRKIAPKKTTLCITESKSMEYKKIKSSFNGNNTTPPSPRFANSLSPPMEKTRTSRTNGDGLKVDKRTNIKLNAEISHTRSTIDLLKIFLDNESIMNKVVLSNLWNKIGRQRDSSNPRHTKVIMRMMQCTFHLIDTCGPRELANIAHGTAKARLATTESKRFLKVIGKTALTRGMHGFKPQELVNLIWSFATAGVSEGKLYEAIASEALARQLCGFKPQELANLVWSFEKGGERNNELFIAVGNEAIRQNFYGFKPQEISNITWVFARAGISDNKLYTAVAQYIMKKQLIHFNPQDLSNTVWAFASAGLHSEEVYMAIAEEAMQHLNLFKPKELSSLIWSFAKADVFVDDLYVAVAKETVQRRLKGFNAQNVSNIVWAFATAGARVDTLFATVADDALRPNISSFNPQELSNTIWAFASAGFCARSLFKAVINEALRRNLSSFQPQHLVNITWALATVCVHDTKFYMAVADEAVSRNLKGFELNGLANLVWSFGVADINHSPIFRKAIEVIKQARPSDFSKGVLVSLHQWLMWLHLEHGASYDAFNLPDLRSRCEEAMQDPSIRVSRLQRNVWSIIFEVKDGFEEELVDDFTSYSIDIASQALQIAVEVDGPSHFTASPNDTSVHYMNGSTLFKRRLLTAAGWRVINLPHYELNALQSVSDKKKYINNLLEGVGI